MVPLPPKGSRLFVELLGACELKRTLAVPAYPKRNIVFPQCGHGYVLILFAFGILSWSRFNITCKFTSRLSAFNPFK